MWQRASAAQRWALLVALAALALAALNIWWVEAYRSGFPFDIDESGYTAFGLVDRLGLHNGGLHGWWDAIQGQPTFAPLIPALTSLTVAVKPGVLNGFAVLTAFLFVLALAAYCIGECLAGPRLGALAALVSATMPGVFAFSREYVFALPTAALLACAVFATLKSDGMKKRWWAIACGVAIGLMLLTRTMAITYVPGLLLAAALAIFVRARGDLPGRVLNLTLTIITAVAVASTWYARNLQSVIDYLTNYGYGKQSEFYGSEQSLIGWGRFRAVGEHMISEDFFLPLAVVLLVGVATVLAVMAKRLLPRAERRAELLRLAGSDAFGVGIVFIVGYVILMSSQNQGNGFTLPLAVLLPPLAVLALRRFPSALVPSVLVLGAIAAVNLVSTATIWAFASHTRQVSLPGFKESLPITKGVPKAVFAIRSQIPGPETIFDVSDARWPDADTALVDVFDELYGPNGEAPVIAFASRNRALNSNTVELASLVKYLRGFPVIQMEAEPNDSVATYRHWLTASEFGRPNVLVTMNRSTDDFPTAITQTYAEIAAKRLGFRKIRTIPLPNRREMYVWHKRMLSPAKPEQSTKVTSSPDRQ
jgi:hypothetical protein